MSIRTFLIGIALIVGVWLIITASLAAGEAWQSLHPAGPPRPQATPRADTTINCHRGEPPTRSPYLAVARADAQHYGIDALTFTWKIWQESSFNPTVHDSSAGAIGIAQFEPGTAQGMGIDPRDPGRLWMRQPAWMRNICASMRRRPDSLRLTTEAMGRAMPTGWRSQLMTRDQGNGLGLAAGVWWRHALAGEWPLGLAEVAGQRDESICSGHFRMFARREEHTLTDGRFMLGATVESAEQGRLVFGSNDWIEGDVQALGLGIRVELRVEGPGVTLRMVGFHPDGRGVDQPIYSETLPR